ncbi:MAG: glycosyltransferase [Azospirillaceae bacterium]
MSGNKDIAIIVGPFWPNTGVGEYIKNQINYFRSKGYTTAFIGLPIERDQHLRNNEWVSNYYESKYYDVDAKFLESFNKRIHRPKFRKLTPKSMRRFNSLTWRAYPPHTVPVGDEVVKFINSGQVKYVVCNMLYFLSYSRKLINISAARGEKPKSILATIDIQTHQIIDSEFQNPYTKKVDNYDDLIRTELELIGEDFDILVHVSVDDLEFFKNKIKKSKQYVLYPGMPDREVELKRHYGKYLFVGANNSHNVEAVRWLLAEVRPWLGSRPVDLSIVGAVAEPFKKFHPILYSAFANCFIGPVDDVSGYYANCDAALIPMRTGHGISVKTIEAASYSVPIISTRNGLRGVDEGEVARIGIECFDSPKNFAKKMISIQDEREQEMIKSRRLFNRYFSLEKFNSSMDKILSENKFP